MEKRIKACEIKEGKYMNTISVVYDDGSVDECLATYYPDELSFSPIEFLELTRKEAQNFIWERDKAYLRR